MKESVLFSSRPVYCIKRTEIGVSGVAGGGYSIGDEKQLYQI